MLKHNSTISARLFPRCWFFVVWHRGSEMVDFYHSRLSFRLLQPSPRGMSERLQRDANALLYIINRNLTSLYRFSIIYQKTDSRLIDWPRETANSNRIENVRRENPEFTMANLGKTAMCTIDRGESRFTVILHVNERRNDNMCWAIDVMSMKYNMCSILS